MEFTLIRLDGSYWIAQLEAVTAEVVARVGELPASAMWSLTRTSDEVSLVSPIAEPPGALTVNGPWAAFRVAGSMEFTLVGVLHRLTGPLRDAGVGVFAISTYDTDYLLVSESDAEAAVAAWTAAGTPMLPT